MAFLFIYVFKIYRKDEVRIKKKWDYVSKINICEYKNDQ